VKIPGNLSIGQGDTICVGESVQLRSNGFEILRWSPASSLNNANIPNPVARPTTTTRYVITGTDSLNCFTDSGFIDVIVYPIPQFNIAETIIKANYGSAIPLRTQSSNDVSRWTWTPASGLNCADCAEPVATITRKQVYTAIATNDGGCIAKDEVAVEPYCTADNVFIPNTFSPNGDGQNDVFFPRGTGFTSIKSMLIFNRWGEVVFERKDFALNDASAGWNGSYKGKPLTPDVYVYVVEVVCANNEVFSLKGNVTLLR
jgi:gliding motility-associated-like protein